MIFDPRGEISGNFTSRIENRRKNREKIKNSKIEKFSTIGNSMKNTRTKQFSERFCDYMRSIRKYVSDFIGFGQESGTFENFTVRKIQDFWKFLDIAQLQMITTFLFVNRF